MKKLVTLVLVSCALSGCSSVSSAYSSASSSVSSTFNSVFSDGTVDMTYNCSPAGATILEEGGTRLGSCPVTVQYHPNADQQQAGKFYTQKLTAVWPDGSVASVPSLTIDIHSNHKAQYTFVETGGNQQMAWNGPDNWGSPPPSPPSFDNGNMGAPIPLNNQMAYGDGPDYRTPAPNAGPAPSTGVSQGSPAGAHQDQDFFDNFNRKATCEINNYIDSKNSGCTPQDGFQ